MSIEVGEEVEKTVYDFPVEIDGEDRAALLRYAQDEITVEEMDELLLQWVMIKILQDKMDEFIQNELTEEDK
jgi:hypothetical protein